MSFCLFIACRIVLQRHELLIVNLYLDTAACSIVNLQSHSIKYRYSGILISQLHIYTATCFHVVNLPVLCVCVVVFGYFLLFVKIRDKKFDHYC